MHTSIPGHLVHYLTNALVGWYGGAMPNLVVYVPADVARALEARGVSEDLQRRACKEVLAGLADGGLGAGDKPAGATERTQNDSGSGGKAPSGRATVVSPAPSPRDPGRNVREFKPDFKGKGKT